MKNNISLKKVLKSNLEECVCENHLRNYNFLFPILLIMYKEDNINRGHFQRHIISNNYSERNNEDIVECKYSEGLNLPSQFVNKNRKFSQDFDIITKTLKYTNTEELSIIQQFLKKLICDEEKLWHNTTFILQDEDSLTLVILSLIDYKHTAKLSHISILNLV